MAFKCKVDFVVTDRGVVIVVNHGGHVAVLGSPSWLPSLISPRLLQVESASINLATRHRVEPELVIVLDGMPSTLEATRVFRFYTAESLGPTLLAVTPEYEASYHVIGHGPARPFLTYYGEGTGVFYRESIGRQWNIVPGNGDDGTLDLRLVRGSREVPLKYTQLFDCTTGQLVRTAQAIR
jgi:hypothetical protein